MQGNGDSLSAIHEASKEPIYRNIFKKHEIKYSISVDGQEQKPKKTVTPRFRWKSMARAIADKHNISIDQMLGPCRTPAFAYARQQFMYEMIASGRCSYSFVARILNRDHSTIIHGVEAHAKRNGVPSICKRTYAQKRFR